MKKVILLILISTTLQAQIMPTYFPNYESNKGKGNGKLFYRLYSLANIVFPDTESQMDAFYGTYGTFRMQNLISIATNKGTTNSSTLSASNLINFSNTDLFKNAISNNTPYSGFDGEQYGLIITGYFIPKQSGLYKFTIEGDDAVDVFINGANIANHYGGHGASPLGTHTGTINLIAGKKYSLRIRFMENGAGDQLFLFWQKPSETNGAVWYQDAEELSTEEVMPNGLVMNIDPSNFYSYPKSGTVVSDLKGNMNGTLYDMSFVNSNQGIFQSDGDQDYINIGANPTNYPTGDISVFVWVKPTTFRNGWNIFLTKWFTSTGTSGNGGVSDFHFAIYPNGGAYYLNLNLTNVSAKFGVTPLSINTWYYFGFTVKNGVSAQMYCNGNLDGSAVNGASRTNYPSGMLFIGDPRYGNSTDFIGQMGSIQIYNRELSTDEVLQNFNATKHRYGL